MGDFADLLAGIPAFEKPALRESFVDTHGHEIVRITPLDGAPAFFLSSIPVTTTQGQMLVQFPIKAGTIEEACAAWQECARAAVAEFGAKMRENARRIVLPGNPAANSVPFKRLN